MNEFVVVRDEKIHEFKGRTVTIDGTVYGPSFPFDSVGAALVDVEQVNYPPPKYATNVSSELAMVDGKPTRTWDYELDTEAKEADERLEAFQQTLGPLADRSIREVAVAEAVQRIDEVVKHLAARASLDYPGIEDLGIEMATDAYIELNGLEQHPDFEAQRITRTERKKRLAELNKELRDNQ